MLSCLNGQGVSRRVSCQDLGNGDCEGWLWKKLEKPGLVSKDWRKYWFTLKDKNLYYYKRKKEDIAKGVFKMPAFVVSPAGDQDSSRKFAFKACNPKYGTFLFASERKEDMDKWMDMLRLACLPDMNSKQLNTMDTVTEAYSGSESEEERAPDSGAGFQSPESRLQSTPSAEAPLDLLDLSDLETSKRMSGLIEMTIRRDPRSSFQKSIKGRSRDACLRRHLASLQRTLKDKEMQVNILKEFFGKSAPVTSESLKNFVTLSIFSEIVTGRNNDSASYTEILSRFD